MIQRNNIIIIVFLIAVTFLVYANSFKNEFVWDDSDLIADNDYIKDFGYAGKIFTMSVFGDKTTEFNFYRPVQGLSFMLDYSLWGLNSLGYHITNTILHALNAILVYFIILTIYKSWQTAMISALFFSIHPVQTEAVTYISGRADGLTALFLLISLIFFIKDAHQSRKIFFFASIISFMLALLSKESAIIFPLIIILYSFCLVHKENRSYLLRAYLSAFLIILGGYLILRTHIFNSPDHSIRNLSENLYPRLLSLGRIIISYIGLLFFPVGLHMERSIELVNSIFKVDFLIPCLLLGLIIFLGLKAFKRSKAVFFSFGWFFIFLSPVLNIVPINALMAEHWLYLPSVGFFTIIALGASNLLKYKGTFLKRVTIVILSLAGIFYSYLTVKRNTEWSNEIGFYENTLRYNPNSPRIHMNLGLAYSAKGEFEKAIDELKEAIRLNPAYTEAYYNLGNVYLEMGKNVEAVYNYKKALETDPGYFKAHYNLAKTYAEDGRYDDSIRTFKEAIKSNPKYANVYNNLGLVYSEKGSLDLAISELNKALELKPDYAEVYYNLGIIYDKKGEFATAIEKFKKAISLNPKLVNANINLGIVYIKQGLYDLADNELKKALELDPNNVLAYYNFGIICSRRGDFSEAVSAFKKAVEIKPDFKEAKDKLKEIEK